MLPAGYSAWALALASGAEDPAGEVLKDLIERGVGISEVADREE